MNRINLNNKTLFPVLMIFFVAAIFLFDNGAFAAPRAKWTIMYYMIAEPDIEGPQLDNLLEMGKGGADANIKVVVQADFSNAKKSAKKTLTGNDRFDNTARFVVGAKSINMVRNLGELNAGDPQVLIDYMRWAIDNYPAEKYALIFDCHSSGVESYYGPGSANYHSRSLAYDDYEMDSLTLVELEDAIKQISREKFAGKKLDFLGLASCVTMQVEFLAQVKTAIRYIAGSQSDSVAGIVDWEALLKELRKDPSISGLGFSKLFARYLIGTGFSGTLGSMLKRATASAFDLDKFDPVLVAMNDLSSKLIKIPKSQLTFQDQMSTSDYIKRYYDLGHLIKAILDGKVGFKNHLDYQIIRRSAVELNNAIARSNLATWTVGGWNNKGLIGMGIYWPMADRYPSFKHFYTTLRFAQVTRWDDFLNLKLLGESPSLRNNMDRLAALNQDDINDDSIYEARDLTIQEIFSHMENNPQDKANLKLYIQGLDEMQRRGFFEFIADDEAQ